MDMKKERRKVYLRCFVLLLGLWLALAGVFSAYILQDARAKERQRFIQAANDLAGELRANSYNSIEVSYASFLLRNPEREDVSLAQYFSMLKEDRKNWIETDAWNSIVRWYEADKLTTAALFTYDGQLHWQTAKPGTVGAEVYHRRMADWGSYTVFPTGGWGRSANGGDMPFNLLDFFDYCVMEEIHRELEADPNISIWVEAYCDGENYYPLTMSLERGLGTDAVKVGAYESTRGLPADPETLRELGAFNGNTLRAAKQRPDGRWMEYDRIFTGAVRGEFRAICNGSPQLEDIAADPSRLMVHGEDYPQDRPMTDYTVDSRVLQESAWSLLDRTYTAQVGAGSVVTDEDPETSVLTSHPVYWLQIAGRSDVWSVAGLYWLATILISLAGFLAAAWLLAYTTWRGQRTHLLYERRTRETTAAIAHDLKTPLAVIRACAENLREGVQPEKGSFYMDEIVSQTAVMDRALLDMLELSRVERPGATLRLEEVSWRELLEGRLASLSPLLAGLDLSVEAEGAVRADRAQLERLADNLLRNALEHSDGVVRVRADAERLCVFNSGPPIPEEELPRIWEPYFKGDAARKGGSGLGLSLVASIAKSHGWTCAAANGDGGVTFTVTLSPGR